VLYLEERIRCCGIRSASNASRSIGVEPFPCSGGGSEHGSSSVKFIEYPGFIGQRRAYCRQVSKSFSWLSVVCGSSTAASYPATSLSGTIGSASSPIVGCGELALRWQQLNFTWGKGKLEMLHNVKLYKHHSVNGVSGIARENQQETLWLIVSSEPTTLQTLQEYGLRFDIEENFQGR